MAAAVLLVRLVAFVLLASSPSVVPAAESWHVALRTDGSTGTGTAADPFDGSTPEKLAAAFAAIPAGRLNVQLGPGTYVTRTTLDVKSGWTVRGAGPARTVLQLAEGVLTKADEGALVIGRSDYGGAPALQERACVRDLAIDGNRAGQPAYRLGAPSWVDAVRLWAKDGRIENVHVRNTYTRPGEGFPVTIYSTGGTPARPHRAEIVRVRVDRHEGYATSIAAFDQTGGRLTGGIRRCVVLGYGGAPSSAAFGSGGWQDFVVEHNRVEGMAAGVVIDTHDYRRVRLIDNDFRGLWKCGFLINGKGRYERLTIARNRVELLAREPGAFLQFDAARITGLRVRRNTFRGNRYAVLLATGPAVRGVISGNRVPRRARFELPRGSRLEVRDRRR